MTHVNVGPCEGPSGESKNNSGSAQPKNTETLKVVVKGLPECMADVLTSELKAKYLMTTTAIRPMVAKQVVAKDVPILLKMQPV